MEYWKAFLDRRKLKTKKQNIVSYAFTVNSSDFPKRTKEEQEAYEREVYLKYFKNGKLKLPPISWEECRQVPLENKKIFYKTKELRTIFYYGGKVSFQEDFHTIFEYLKEELHCSKFLDAFGGSGILSILAGRLGYEVYLNDGLDLVVNYHRCLKDWQYFYQFMVGIENLNKRFKYLTKDEVVRELLKLEGEGVPERPFINSELVDNNHGQLTFEKPVFRANLMRHVSDEEVDRLYNKHKDIIDVYIKEKEDEYTEQRRALYKEIALQIDGHIFEWYDDEKMTKMYDTIDEERKNKAIKSDKEFKPVERIYYNDEQKKKMLYWYEHDARPNVKWAVLYYAYRYYTFYGNTSFAPGREHIVHNILDLVNTQRYYENIKSISRSYYKKFINNDLFNPNAVIMLDPPYRDETRVEQGAYKTWEFTEKQHRYFLEFISQPGIKAKILVCGYTSSFYDRRLHKYNLEKGCTWQKVRILRAGVKERGARECLWVNFDFKPIIDLYPDSFELVDEKDWDYRYLTKRKKKELKEQYNITDDNN